MLATGILGVVGTGAVPAVPGQPHVAWTLVAPGGLLTMAAVAGIVLVLLRRPWRALRQAFATIMGAHPRRSPPCPT